MDHKSPMPSVIVLSFLYPATMFALINLFSVSTPAAGGALTLLSSILIGKFAFWALAKDNICLDAIGWKIGNLWRASAIIVLGWAIIGGIIILLGEKGVGQHLPSPILLIQQWFFVGMAEELLFRGYLLNRLTIVFTQLWKTRARLWALVTSSLLFASIHIPVRLHQGLSWVQVLVSVMLVFVLGVYFGFVYLRTRNIILTGLVHGSWNVPLIGVQGAFLQVLVFLCMIELLHYLSASRH